MKPKKCELKIIVRKNRSRKWEIICNGNWIATFKYEHDATSYVDTKTFMLMTVLDGIHYAP